MLLVLYESASGIGLFERVQGDEVAVAETQSSYADLDKFSKLVTLRAFLPYTSAENALDCATSLSEGVVTEYVRHFLTQNMPSKAKKSKKKEPKYILGVQDQRLGASIQEELGYACETSNRVMEIARGIRMHFHRFIQGLEQDDQVKAQLGLGHSYSRSKVKFNVNRIDNMVIQSIAMLDQLDKDLNTFAMRVKEWYGWHFPELSKVVSDNVDYCRACIAIGRKESLKDSDLDKLEEVTGDATVAQQVLDAARASMGTEIADIDLINMENFARRVVSLASYRQSLYAYLQTKMSAIAPNLTQLIGEQVGARLISHAGSLTNLAKYPASTVQILGAEKALFRALKNKSNTPKYGLIFNSTFISRANTKNKGRISRYLANKCSIASRVDCFSDVPTSIYGDKLRQQVEDRLTFYETGDVPAKNVDVMHEAFLEVQAAEAATKRKAPADTPDAPKPEKKKKKKDKKKKE